MGGMKWGTTEARDNRAKNEGVCDTTQHHQKRGKHAVLPTACPSTPGTGGRTRAGDRPAQAARTVPCQSCRLSSFCSVSRKRLPFRSGCEEGWLTWLLFASSPLAYSSGGTLEVRQSEKGTPKNHQYTDLRCLQFCQSLYIGAGMLFIKERQGGTAELREEDLELDTTGQRLEPRWRLEV